MTALVDTGVLLATVAEGDKWHDICRLAIEEESDLLVPDVVLPELAYLVLREVGYPALTQMLRAIAADELRLLSTTSADLARTAEILDQYADTRVDFVDCVIMALAERLNITRILTVDRRHFSLFRPRHCPTLELIP